LLGESHNNPYDTALSIQTFLLAIPYDKGEAIPPPGYDPVDWFLNVQHVGFSNYYASAMVTMLRSLGIPSRMVVGFAPGEWDDERDAWVVRSKHYHAWPEVYFPQYGWVEFEPTPIGVQPGLEELTLASEEVLLTEDVTFLDECSLMGIACEQSLDLSTEEARLRLATDEEADDAIAIAGDDSGGLTGLIIVWLASAIGAAAFAFVSANLYLRYLTARLGVPAVVYSSMSLLATLGGSARQHHFTPTEYGSRVASQLPEHRDSISQIVKGYEISRYSQHKRLGDEQSRGLRTSWKSLRWALLGLVFRRLIPFV